MEQTLPHAGGTQSNGSLIELQEFEALDRLLNPYIAVLIEFSDLSLKFHLPRPKTAQTRIYGVQNTHGFCFLPLPEEVTNLPLYFLQFLFEDTFSP